MLRGHRSGNPSVVAITTQFVVDVEKMVMAPAIVVQPISGFALASAMFVVAVACWLAAFRLEIRVRRFSRQSALDAVALPDDYRRMFRAWSVLAAAGLLATTAIFALMIWQPRLD
jgi:uncharacterized membrane protein